MDGWMDGGLSKYNEWGGDVICRYHVDSMEVDMYESRHPRAMVRCSENLTARAPECRLLGQ